MSVRLAVLLLAFPLLLLTSLPAGEEISSASYGSVQEAIRANPGRMIYVPSGDYKISEGLQIFSDNTGLFGPGRIIQTNAAAAIVEIKRAKNVQLRDLTLMRSEEAADSGREGVYAVECQNLEIENLQLIDNRAPAGGIVLRQCSDSQIRGCLVQNYMRISVDDRTASKDWGYAFNCIDGTGILVDACADILIQGNRIIERDLLPTPELKERFHLGQFCRKAAERGELVSEEAWSEGYVNNWHQGSAICVADPRRDDHIQILGNLIENAAQGIDVHADHVIVSQNIVDNAFIGMKAMHGARNVLIIGNQFSRNDLWSIGLMPGASSGLARAPVLPDQKPEETEANVDGGSIIANNIISDFGYGTAHWIWGDEGCPLRLDHGQKPENPPLSDVIVQGNLIYDTGRDRVLINGKPTTEAPRYKYAVFIGQDRLAGLGVIRGPQGLHFSGNLFHPGREGVSNVPLQP